MQRRTLALLLDHPIGEYQDELRVAVERAALANDLNLLTVIGRALSAPRPGEQALNTIYDRISAPSVAGVIISGVVGTQCTEARLLALRDRLSPLPLCSIGVRIRGVPALAIDDKNAMRLMVEHMIAHGRQRIAFICGPSTSEEALQRYQAYVEGLQAHGLAFDEALVAIGNFDISSGTSAMEAILARGVAFDAVIASNDNMALGASEAVKAAARTDIVIVGFDANPDAAAAVLAGDMAATVAQAPGNMGGFAIQALVDLKAGKTLEPWIDTGTVLVTKDNADAYK